MDGVPRESGFDITAASEVMAVLALSNDLADMRARLGRIVVGYTRDGDAVTAEDIHGAGAMAALLRDALKPNLMQTLENTPVLVHAGPFGNIAHGNSSIVADRIGIHGGDYLVTEAGFGADMGAERFFNIKCRTSGMAPDAAVVVATVRALKAHSGNHKIVAGKACRPRCSRRTPRRCTPARPTCASRSRTCACTASRRWCASTRSPPTTTASTRPSARSPSRWARGSPSRRTSPTAGAGAAELAEAVAEAANEESHFQLLYPDDASLREKIETIATKVYGADGVDYAPAANTAIDLYERNGFGDLPVCIAKTHLSISSDPKLLGAPTGWRMPVREVRASVGAGFIYPICGDMRTMPGLGKNPAAHHIDVKPDGDDRGAVLSHLCERFRGCSHEIDHRVVRA